MRTMSMNKPNSKKTSEGFAICALPFNNNNNNNNQQSKGNYLYGNDHS
jgi:hypothetical protein